MRSQINLKNSFLNWNTHARREKKVRSMEQSGQKDKFEERVRAELVGKEVVKVEIEN